MGWERETIRRESGKNRDGPSGKEEGGLHPDSTLLFCKPPERCFTFPVCRSSRKRSRARGEMIKILYVKEQTMQKDSAISPGITSSIELPMDFRPSPAALLKRGQYLVEEADWDRDLIKLEKWMDRVCWFCIAVALAYFLPVSFLILTR